jgi:dihydropteroate synthase
MRPTSVLAGLPIGGDHPVRLMAAINVSPESFFAASVRTDAGALRAAAQQAVQEGADIVDIGAKSTAPYLQTAIALDEEVRRMSRAVQVVSSAVSVPVSADTTRAAVAAAALAGGARIINDVSGLRGDPAMADIAAQGEGVVLMASPDGGADGAPLDLVRRLLSDSLARAQHAGIAPAEIVLDPGIGFFTQSGVSAAGSLRGAEPARGIGRPGMPLLVGPSRKSFIGAVLDLAPAERLEGTLAACVAAVQAGAHILRVHDVGAVRRAVRVAEAIGGW